MAEERANPAVAREVACTWINPRIIEVLVLLCCVAVVAVNVYSLFNTHSNWIGCTADSPFAGPKEGTSDYCNHGGGNGWLGFTRANLVGD